MIFETSKKITVPVCHLLSRYPGGINASLRQRRLRRQPRQHGWCPTRFYLYCVARSSLRRRVPSQVHFNPPLDAHRISETGQPPGTLLLKRSARRRVRLPRQRRPGRPVISNRRRDRQPKGRCSQLSYDNSQHLTSFEKQIFLAPIFFC